MTYRDLFGDILIFLCDIQFRSACWIWLVVLVKRSDNLERVHFTSILYETLRVFRVIVRIIIAFVSDFAIINLKFFVFLKKFAQLPLFLKDKITNWMQLVLVIESLQEVETWFVLQWPSTYALGGYRATVIDWHLLSNTK